MGSEAMIGSPPTAPLTFVLTAPIVMLISAMALVTIVHGLKWAEAHQHGSGSPMWTSYIRPLVQGIVAVAREAMGMDQLHQLKLSLTHVLLTSILFILCSVLQVISQLTWLLYDKKSR